MFCGPTRPRAARRPPFVREQVPAHEHRLPRRWRGAGKPETARRHLHCHQRGIPRAPSGCCGSRAFRFGPEPAALGAAASADAPYGFLYGTTPVCRIAVQATRAAHACPATERWLRSSVMYLRRCTCRA